MRPPTIPVEEIPDEGKSLELALDAAWLREALTGTEYSPARDPSGTTSLRLDKSGNNVLVRGAVDVALSAPCVRCLEPVVFDVHADMVLNLEPAPASQPEHGQPVAELELTSNELDADYYRDEKIELDHWIREQILVEAPSHPVCDKPCELPKVPGAGKEPSIDPRLEPLRRLMKTSKE